MHILTKVGNQDNVVTYEHICDTLQDRDNIEKRYITLGSTCLVLSGENDTIEVYMADSNKEWHDIAVAGGSGGGSGSGGLQLYICTSSEVQDGKPAVEIPMEDILYLVPGGTDGNLYTEYMYVNNNWELFGGATVDLTNYASKQWVQDQHYLNSYTETDPTVPAWAKAVTKPTYTAAEVGALPSSTAIPTKVSDLTNDSGYLVNADIADINTKVTSINNALYRINNLYTSKNFTNVGFIRPAGSTSDNSSYAYTNYIYIGDAKEIIITGQFAASASPAVFYDADKKYISGFTSTITQEVATYSIPVPENAKYVITSCATSRLSNFKVDVIFNHLVKNSSICYISPNGDDSNDGFTPQTPILSCSRAAQILSQEGMLIMMAGDYDYYTLGLDFEITPNILGIDHPRIICYQQKIDNAELVDGYTKVYSITKDFRETLNNAVDFWQHDIPDARSIIPAEEAHPLNRNRTYRLPSTRISHVDSIEAIENSTEPSWYLDGTTFYFSIVEGSSLETNPVIIPIISGSRRYRYGSNNPIDFSIKNIAIYYNCLIVDSACGMLDNVEIGMCYSDAVLSADYCESILLRNCNFYAVSASSGGDGVNVHNENDSIGHRSFVTLENCWLHDCADDGESCHGNSNTVHYGSLIEYNGTGVTPAGGGTTCNNVISRHNGPHSWVNDTVVCAGFSCQSSTSTLTCIGCFSYSNQRGYYCTASETNTQNCFTIINSIAKDNIVSGIAVNRGTIIADNVQIIQTNNAPATFIQNGGTINFTGINSGIDSDGAYLQNNNQKYYIPFNAQIQITDTNPVITAAADTQYICGEVATLSFTPSATGTCDVIFESGITATTLTIPSTVKFPEWFDASALEANMTYEINITNGVYGVVMAWPAS